MTKNTIGNVLEFASKNTRGGKRPIKVVLHEIFDSQDTWQKNGLSWGLEETEANLASIAGSPIAVEYWSKSSDPEDVQIGGHGLVDIVNDENGDEMPLFDSEVVGSFKDGYIDTIEINGVLKTVAIGVGWVYEQRNKGLTDWLVENVPSGTVMGSVEITGKPENHNKILYKDNRLGDGRRPTVYEYSCFVILSASVPPADPASVVLEIEELNPEKVEEEKHMDEIKGMLTELMSRISESSACKEQLEANESRIAELMTQIETLTSERDAKCDECCQLSTQVESNATELNELREKVAEFEKKEKVAEMNSAIEKFTDEQKGFAKDMIEKFNEDQSVEINSIVNTILAGIGQKAIEDAAAAPAHEQNSAAEVDDIFGAILDTKSKSTEDDNIF